MVKIRFASLAAAAAVVGCQGKSVPDRLTVSLPIDELNISTASLEARAFRTSLVGTEYFGGDVNLRIPEKMPPNRFVTIRDFGLTPNTVKPPMTASASTNYDAKGIRTWNPLLDNAPFDTISVRATLCVWERSQFQNISRSSRLKSQFEIEDGTKVQIVGQTSPPGLVVSPFGRTSNPDPLILSSSNWASLDWVGTDGKEERLLTFNGSVLYPNYLHEVPKESMRKYLDQDGKLVFSTYRPLTSKAVSKILKPETGKLVLGKYPGLIPIPNTPEAGQIGPAFGVGMTQNLPAERYKNTIVTQR